MGSNSPTHAASTAKYTPLEHEGLQVVPQDEIAEKRIPLDSPRPHDQETAPKYLASQRGPAYDGADAPESFAPYQEHYAPEHGSPVGAAPKESYASVEAANASSTPPARGKRYLGMRKGIFIGALILLIFIILAVVLGAVLGTVLPKKNSSNSNKGTSSATSPSGIDGGTHNTTGTNNGTTAASPIKPINLSGLASTYYHDNSNTLLVYYQQQDGADNTIYEAVYPSDQQSQSNFAQATLSKVVAGGDGTPLAAISYTLNGTTYRQIFYTDAAGSLYQINATTSPGGSWSDASQVYGASIAGGSPALSACVETEYISGIRLYYATSLGYSGSQFPIQELVYSFNGTNNTDTWTEGHTFQQSDGLTGVACSIYKPSSNTSIGGYINVYLRDYYNGQLLQTYLDLSDLTSPNWFNGPNATNQTIIPGSSVTVTSDESNTEYIYFEQASGNFTRGDVVPYEVQAWSGFSYQGSGLEHSKMAAVKLFSNLEPMFLYQDTVGDLRAYDASRQNTEVFNTTLS